MMQQEKHAAIVSLTLLAALGSCTRSEPTVQAPLVFVFQKQKDPTAIKASADRVAQFLSDKLERKVKTFIPTSYSASVNALIHNKADIAYVSSIPFLLAKRDGGAELLLAEQRVDNSGKARTDYDSVFVVPKDSALMSMQDVAANAADLRIAFTSTHSTSGYVMANWRLVDEGILTEGQDPDQVFKSVAFGDSYTGALRQMLEDRADLCAVSYYTVEGPSATKYLSEDEIKKLRVLARTPGVPTHLICVRGGLSGELKRRIKEALLALSNQEPHLLEDVYGAKTLVEVDPDQHVAKALEAARFLKHLGVELDQLVNKSATKK